jgi:hypothetical protein
MTITAPAEHVFAAAASNTWNMIFRPAASLVLVLADFIVSCTAGTTAMTAHNVA